MVVFCRNNIILLSNTKKNQKKNSMRRPFTNILKDNSLIIDYNVLLQLHQIKEIQKPIKETGIT